MKSKMTKRGYKLQEFLAHSGNVNCLSIGKKKSRLLLTGGDDYKVKLWAVGKPTSLMSLCGHTSPVDSVAFNSTEALVLAGASSGVIKLWNLEEATMVRGFTGLRSNCSVVEFHPFGEYLASGSSDSNLKIWDIRKKGCIQTYKGHTRGISTIKFSPDGRWVVTGGLDNVVKVWDLTAGKLLHDSTFHEGPIRSLDFHPLEFLLATAIGGNSNAAKNPGSLKATLPSELGKVAHIASGMQNALDKSSRRHSVVPRDSYNGEESSHSGKESINFSKTKPGMLLRPAHVKKTLARFEESNQSVVVQSGTRKKSGLDVEEEPHTQNVSVSEHTGTKPFDMEDSTIKSIAGKFEKALSSESSTDEAHRRFLVLRL